MKKFFLLFLFSFCLFQPAFPQALTTNPTQLNFGDVFENVPESLQITITNTLSRDVNVYGIIFYDTYGQPAFSASQQNFTVAASSDYFIWVIFTPRHNIQHNSEMVIINDGLRGYTSIDLIGQGRYSISYYDSTENRSEENLKTVIHSITGTGYVPLGYNVARDSMFMVIDNKKINGQGASQNTIECIYTGREAAGYTSRTDCQTNYSFNTEHTFPQSFFNSIEPMRSDLHHLFPSDDAANNERGDNPYAEVVSPTWSDGGSLSDGDYFEPRDQQKGQSSRALFYFVLRYQNYNGFLTSQENTLRTWHENFFPNPFEVKRNEDIFSMQHNRNPFTDYPQFIERIRSITSTSVSPVNRSLDLPQDTIIYGFVPTGLPVTFHYIIVNDGNADVDLSNFSLSNSSLAFQSGGVNATLAAGETLATEIQLLTSNNDSIHAFLTFESDDPSHAQVSIPVYANDSVFSGIEEAENAGISIFPNPANEIVNVKIHSPGRDKILIEILNMTCENVLMEEKRVGDFYLNIKNLASGIYFLKISTHEKIFFRKMVKE